MQDRGRWSQQRVYKNCGRSDCQGGCAEDSTAKPHGPYTQLRRRNPGDTSQQDTVYLGKEVLSDEQLKAVNAKYSGAYKPTKIEVLDAVK